MRLAETRSSAEETEDIRLARSRSQSSQLVSLSWLYGLLLPPWVCRNSSPARNIGVPLASNSRAAEVLHLSLAQFQTSSRDMLVAFPAAVPTVVLGRAVRVVVAVGLVVFLVVGDQVVQA